MIKVYKNILYTGKGDDGKTTLFNCNQNKISKSSTIIEALGSLDEINAYLGIIKVYSSALNISLEINRKKFISYYQILDMIQQTIFVIQAEIAGSNIFVNKSEINKIEKIIKKISLELPPIKSFTVSGGSLISAKLDYARALSRRTERSVIRAIDESKTKINKNSLTYLNRLSSVLFAMSRYSNFILSIKEEHPTYNK